MSMVGPNRHKQLDDGLWGIYDASNSELGTIVVDSTYSPTIELWELKVPLSNVTAPGGVTLHFQNKNAPDVAERIQKLKDGTAPNAPKWYSISKDTETNPHDWYMLPSVMGRRRKVFQAGSHAGWVFHEDTSSGQYKTHHFLHPVAFKHDNDCTYDTSYIVENLQDSAKNPDWYQPADDYFVTEFDWVEY